VVAALVDAGTPFDLLVLPGAIHSFPGAQAECATGRIRAFFPEHLRGERRAR
jgi:acetyl esterase/lipase